MKAKARQRLMEARLRDCLAEARDPKGPTHHRAHVRRRAWANALSIAERLPCWAVVGDHPARITRRGSRGAVYGVVYYRTRGPGRERQLGGHQAGRRWGVR